MLSTIVLVAVFFGLFLASTVLWALFFRFGLRWAKLQEVSTWRIVCTALTVTILQFALNFLFLSFSPSSDAQSVILGLVQLVAAAIVACSVISVSFKTQFVRAIQAWLPTLLASVIMLTLVLFGLRPFLYEAFVVPTNSMAPTLFGPHCKGTCSECGKASYCTPRSKRDDAVDMQLAICDNFHITESSDIDEVVYGSDRFMVETFLAPER